MPRTLVLALAVTGLSLGACATQSAREAGAELQTTQAQAELSADDLETLEADLREHRGAIQASGARTEQALKALYEGHGFTW